MRLLNRAPFNSPWVAATVARFGLPAWFATESFLGATLVLRDPTYLFFDARLYLAATRAWLDGADPWQVQLAGNYFAAPPPSLLFMVPAALLPADIGVAAVAVAVAAAAVASVRMLRLPWWWLLFPPLVQCVLSANIHALLIPLILASAGPVAALAKIYAMVPLAILGRWRSVLITGLVLVLTIPLLPWPQFLAEWTQISGRLQAQTKLGVPLPLLLLASPAVVAALITVGRERAAWLAVSAIWPAQQFYYGVLVLPARSRLAAAIVALPVPGNGLIALLAVAAHSLHRRRRDGPDHAD